MSSPSAADTAASVPPAGDSTSTVALSVSTSISGSPLTTCSPPLFSQRTSLPVSWAIPRAGMTTSVAIGLGLVEVRLRLAGGRKNAARCVVALARHQKVFGGESGDDLG